VELDELLRPLLEDREVQVVMHGADYDLRLLDRDLGIQPAGLFDTQIAASLLGEENLGLSSLLERFLGIRLSKKYQKADWAERPLPPEMLEYAATDTRHLEELAELLAERLEERGRRDWADEEFRELERIRYEGPDDEDLVTRVKVARNLEPREVARLRAALEWRERIARDRDRALFRVAGDAVLVEVARRRPGSIRALADIQGMNGRLAREEGADLIRRLDAVDAAPAAEIEGYPHPPRGSGRGRPPPEVEERFFRLKKIRNARASELEIARGTLLPNHVLQALAEDPPGSLEAMASTPGMRRWQVEVVGDRVLEVLREPVGTSP
jgi:ribonuclease D